jgi:hypothetical protein
MLSGQTRYFREWHVLIDFLTGAAGTAATGQAGWPTRQRKVTHVLSGETRYFREWHVLIDFLASAAGFAETEQAGWPTLEDDELRITGEDDMSEEVAQRHCLMISEEAGEGTTGWTSIVYLDWLDADGTPHCEDLASRYAGFKKLGDDGWKLVQVVERPASEGVFDGPVAPRTHFYFRRPARAKG